ncbi:hypothetical protein ACOSP7_001093 [Xanthoceras sorbifolium]
MSNIDQQHLGSSWLTRILWTYNKSMHCCLAKLKRTLRFQVLRSNTKISSFAEHCQLKLFTVMNCEKAISFGSGGSTTTLLPKSVGILLVDGDSTCLTILSKMLRRFRYKGM